MKRLFACFLPSLGVLAMMLPSCQPHEQPEPPQPQPTDQTIQVDTVDELIMATGIPKKDNHSIVIKWTDDMAVTPENMGSIGKAKKAVNARNDMTMDVGDFEIYFNTDAIINIAMWESTEYHNIGKNPINGALPRVPHNQYNLFTLERGETDVVQMPAPTQTYEFTMTQAAEFSTEVAKIISDEPVNLICEYPTTIKDDATLKLLSSLHVEVLGARVNIIDADGDPADLDVGDLYTKNWDLRPGGTAYWVLASGVKTRIVCDEDGVPVPGGGEIIFPSSPENTLTLTTVNGQQDFAMVEFNPVFLPTGYDISRPINDQGEYRYLTNFTFDAGKTGFYIPEKYTQEMEFIPYQGGFDVWDNSARIMQYFENNDIVAKNVIYMSDWSKYPDIYGKFIVWYDDYLMVREPRLTGKEITRLNPWVNPSKRER